MAIDTAEKRKSASQTITGLFGPGVTPNSGTDQEWRQQSGWGYSGILASNPTASVFDVIANIYYRQLMSGGTVGGTT